MKHRLEWREEYAVAVRQFDEDHQHLITLARKVADAVEAGAKIADLRAALDDLIEEALAHFESEERTMAEVDYPELAEHRDGHNHLIRTYIKYKAELRYERLDADEVAGFMIDWLLVHIQTFDKRYGDFFNARGVK